MKRTVAIIAGGDSSEHEVSMNSAKGIYSFIDKEKYNLYIVELKLYFLTVHVPKLIKTTLVLWMETTKSNLISLT